MTTDDTNPTPPAPTPTLPLPPEVREAIAQALYYADCEAGKPAPWPSRYPAIRTHYYKMADAACAALAPLWPRPAPVTADARELAERIHKAVFAGESHPDAETDAIADGLAPVLARAEAAEAKLAAIEEDGTKEHNAAVELRSQLAARIKESEARVDWAVKMLAAVTQERDQLRAEVERLKEAHLRFVSEAQHRGTEVSATERAMHRFTVEQLHGMVASLRAQLAAAQEALERIATYDAPDTQAMIEIARAARREGGRHD